MRTRLRWNALRSGLARILWAAQRAYQRLSIRLRKRGLGWLFVNRWTVGGRWVDWEPMACECCGWKGPCRWLIHDYVDDGTGEDVVPEDRCPRCGSEEVTSLAILRVLSGYHRERRSR
jgi:hypothetical protein